GRPITMLVPPDRPDEEQMILDKLRRGERIDHFETVRVAKDGRRVEVSVTVSPIRDADGRVIGASNISHDITDRQRMEETLRLQAEELAESNRRKDEFLAMLAHELRNPLAPIRNAVRLLGLPGADPSLERSQGGLGIGLTLVKSLVELHGGSVEAHSAGPGKGSEFVVRLPALPRALPGAAPRGAGGAGGPVPRRRVLVVDDNADA